jgi:hypothetical protein
MFCPNCGAQTDGGKFCGACGSPLPMVPESALKENAPAPVPVSDPLPWEAPITNPEPAPETAEALSGPQYGGPQYQPYNPVPSEPAPAGPEKTKKAKPWLWIAIAGGALLLAALVLLAVFVFFKKDPTAQVGQAAAKSMTALSKTEPGKIASELEKAEVKVSMDLSSVVPYMRGVDGSVELTFSEDMDAGKIYMLLSLLMKGKEVADVGVFMDEKALAVSSDTLLGSDAYGVNFETLPDDLKKSIFAPKSGSYYALPQDVYNILRQLDQSPVKLYKEARGSMTELAEEGGKKFLSALKEHAEITKSDGKLSVGSGKAECTVIKAEADEKATRAILEDMADWLKEEKTKEKLLRFFNVYAKVMDIAQGGRSKQDGEDLLDSFYDGLDDALDEAEDVETVMSFYINKANGQLIGFALEYEGDDSEGSLEIAAGPDFSDPEEFRLTIDDDGYKEVYTVEVTENSDSTFAAEITVEEGRYKENYEFEWKKKRGTFEFTEDGYTRAEGTLKIEGDSIHLELEEPGVTIDVTKGAKTKDVPKFKNLLELTEDEFDDLVDEIEDQIQDLAF